MAKRKTVPYYLVSGYYESGNQELKGYASRIGNYSRAEILQSIHTNSPVNIYDILIKRYNLYLHRA